MEKEKNIFEVAVRTKMRFPFKGSISVEDLWDLNENQLDSIFKVLNSELKQAQEESLLETKTQQNEELDTKIKIIKHIVQVKLIEKQAKSEAKKKKEKKQKLLELLASKQDEEDKNKSTEEIQKMIDELDN